MGAKADAPDLVLHVFAKYMTVMRGLQTIYVLEPAGSHGVWGLDDFHALPFLFGAAQLVGREDEIPTGEVYKEKVVKEYADKYLYVDAIHQVLLAKRGAPFHETSPMLYDITAVPNWQKTHNGLVKMYTAEVLQKFPVIQHFLFGSIIRWPGDGPSSRSSLELSCPPFRLPSVRLSDWGLVSSCNGVIGRSPRPRGPDCRSAYTDAKRLAASKLRLRAASASARVKCLRTAKHGVSPE